MHPEIHRLRQLGIPRTPEVYNSLRPPPGYVAGVGRGAVGHTLDQEFGASFDDYHSALKRLGVVDGYLLLPPPPLRLPPPPSRSLSPASFLSRPVSPCRAGNFSFSPCPSSRPLFLSLSLAQPLVLPLRLFLITPLSPSSDNRPLPTRTSEIPAEGKPLRLQVVMDRWVLGRGKRGGHKGQQMG